MIITRATNKIKEYIAEKKVVNDSFWFNKLKFLGISINPIDFEIIDGDLLLRKLNLKLNKNQAFFLEGYFDSLRLYEELKGRFINKDDRILLNIDDVQVYINSKQEIFIIKEVFLNKCYNFIFKENSILIDIGFNVGISSLFLGRNEFVKKVYGFEPFAKTLEYANENLNLNLLVKSKTELFNFGLSDKDKKLMVNYSLENKGSVSTSERIINTSSYRPNKKSDETVNSFEVDLKSASSFLSTIIEANKHLQIVFKIDCEGGEFEIIDSLYQYNLLNSIDVIMMEWHFDNPEQMINQLSQSNFDIIQTGESNVHGMIYAFNQSK